MNLMIEFIVPQENQERSKTRKSRKQDSQPHVTNNISHEPNSKTEPHNRRHKNIVSCNRNGTIFIISNLTVII